MTSGGFAIVVRQLYTWDVITRFKKKTDPKSKLINHSRMFWFINDPRKKLRLMRLTVCIFYRKVNFFVNLKIVGQIFVYKKLHFSLEIF